jgi:hypothetical protein
MQQAKQKEIITGLMVEKGGLVWFGLGVFDDVDTIWKVQDDDGF